MAGPMPLQGDRAAWCREKLDFFCAVINGVNRERLKAELETCETEDDAMGLMQSLIWLQDNMQTQHPDGAAADDPPDQHDLPRVVHFPEEHEEVPVFLHDAPALHHHQADHCVPVAQGEPEVLLQDYVQDLNTLEGTVHPHDHYPHPYCVAEEEKQQQIHPEVQELLAPRPDSHQRHAVHDLPDDNHHEEAANDTALLGRRPADDTSDSEDLMSFEDLTGALELSEDPKPPHRHGNNAAMAASLHGDDNTELTEPTSEREESGPYFDADELSAEDFEDVEVSLDDDLVEAELAEAELEDAERERAELEEAEEQERAELQHAEEQERAELEEAVLIEEDLAAQTQDESAMGDPAVEGAVGRHEENTEDDARLAQELYEEMNREYRERLESDERMARELLEQMEMEERRREEEDEQLARRLAGEMEVMEQQQQQPQLQNNTLTEDEFDDDIVFQAEVEEDVGGDEDMARQLEAEAQAEAEALQPREEEDERAGRVAALINMFPDADPTFLDDRMEEVNNEEDFRHAVEALLACQRTEPRMSGHQRKLKQCRAAPDALDDAALHNPHQEFLGLPAATLAAASVRVMECTICFEEEVPLKDVASCNALYKYHEFCIECIRKHVAALIGQGHNSFRCMNGYCEAEFSWRTLRRVMEPVVYRKVQERRQQEEVRAAGMDNLVSCPFCCFMIIMPDPENKVLECLNPECLKESCRVCKEPSHIPLRCEEVERDDQKDARTVLENKMAEAMIRQCPKCEKRFVTEGGCNKMTCACGTVMCYLCKAVITQGYHHFEQRGVASNKCPLWSNAVEVHTGEVREAATRGRQELGEDMRLVFDPTRDLL